jgi:hypothetical protein
LREQKETYAQSVADLQKKLVSMEFPLAPLSPEQFQDRLRKSVADISQRAEGMGVKLPEKFYLGFDRYQAEPPRAEAAGLLGRQLSAVEFVVTKLLDSRVEAINAIQRTPLPEEAGAAQKTTPAKGAPVKGGAQPQKGAASNLVNLFPFEIAFTAEQNRFRRILNDLSSGKERFLVVRNLRVKNQNEKGPSREEEIAPQPAAPEEPGSTPAPAGIKPIVGTERIEATMRIDTVDFADSLPKL